MISLTVGLTIIPILPELSCRAEKVTLARARPYVHPCFKKKKKKKKKMKMKILVDRYHIKEFFAKN